MGHRSEDKVTCCTCVIGDLKVFVDVCDAFAIRVMTFEVHLTLFAFLRGY
jgi:hypothetical protein